MTLHIEAEFPPAFACFLEGRERLPDGSYSRQGRYKIRWGGRGGAKSWAAARALLIRGLSGNLRVLCTREVQSSIKDSVHKLLKDQIRAMGIGPVWEGGSGHYRVLDDLIRGPNGTEFIFKGLRDPESLKSAEGVDICWVEEARNVSDRSWEKLAPTVRKAGSEIWVTFNPELDIDPTYQRFVKDPPPGADVLKVGWRDNPWFPDDLRDEKDTLKAKDYDAYLNVWEGHCRVALEGAVYARELREATEEGRIRKGPIFERAKPVHTFWDLGRSDLTAIWFAQIVGFEHRVIGYYSANGYDLTHYLEVLQARGLEKHYVYGTHWLPHDADHKLLGMQRTIRQQMLDAGHRVRITASLPVVEGINAARTLFPTCYFDEAECAEGLNALRYYHYAVNDLGTRSKNPVHDWSSNGADAFRYMGLALRDDPIKTRPKARTPVKVRSSKTSWLR